MRKAKSLRSGDSFLDDLINLFFLRPVSRSEESSKVESHSSKSTQSAPPEPVQRPYISATEEQLSSIVEAKYYETMPDLNLLNDVLAKFAPEGNKNGGWTLIAPDLNTWYSKISNSPDLLLKLNKALHEQNGRWSHTTNPLLWKDLFQDFENKSSPGYRAPENSTLDDSPSALSHSSTLSDRNDGGDDNGDSFR